MARHHELLEEGPRTAPEPETAEQRSARVAKRGLAVTAVAAGIAVKTGAAAKAGAWLIAFHGTSALWRAAGWVGLVIGVMVVILVGVLATRGSGGEFDPKRLRRLFLAVPILLLAFTIGSDAAFTATWWWTLAVLAVASFVAILVFSRRAERVDYSHPEAPA